MHLLNCCGIAGTGPIPIRARAPRDDRRRAWDGPALGDDGSISGAGCVAVAATDPGTEGRAGDAVHHRTRRAGTDAGGSGGRLD
eukprot:COSAG02_NODE_38_length_48090_cov_107.207060_34_plen_83_part_01